MLSKATAVLGALIAIALVTRVVYELMRPALPLVFILFTLLFIIRVAITRHRYW
jgi:hypothetical protein